MLTVNCYRGCRGAGVGAQSHAIQKWAANDRRRLMQRCERAAAHEHKVQWCGGSQSRDAEVGCKRAIVGRCRGAACSDRGGSSQSHKAEVGCKRPVDAEVQRAAAHKHEM
uniref:Uncharacterized protein n=1 Tax=Manihot esculenta TaxID=3983 RepID=A0A2C9WFN4_MANES